MFASTLKASLLTADLSTFLLRGDGERSVADRGEPCQWYSQCRGRWQAQALSTRKLVLLSFTAVSGVL